MTAIIWHDLDPVKREATTAQKIETLKKYCQDDIAREQKALEQFNKASAKEKGRGERMPKPSAILAIEKSYAERIEEEREYYAKVRIKEIVQAASESQFLLVYDAVNHTGTGPFVSLEKAEEWFYGQGR